MRHTDDEIDLERYFAAKKIRSEEMVYGFLGYNKIYSPYIFPMAMINPAPKYRVDPYSIREMFIVSNEEFKSLPSDKKIELEKYGQIIKFKIEEL